MTYQVIGVELLPIPEPVLEPSQEFNDRLLRFYVLHLMEKGLRRRWLKPEQEGAKA